MKKTIFLLSISSLILTGCPKHEVIPAPTSSVELQGHLTGTVNGAAIELTPNVGGYSVSPTKTKIIQTSPQPSSAVYYSSFKSTQSNVSVSIGVGSILWDSSVSEDPSVSQFNTFFSSPAATSPSYSLGAVNGFEVVYRDGAGNVWTSKDSDASNTVAFTNVSQESDATGDYSKFLCNFSCKVYRLQQNPSPQPPTELTTTLDNMEFQGWFKR